MSSRSGFPRTWFSALAVSVSTLTAADAPKKDRPHVATVVKVDADGLYQAQGELR